MKRLMFVFLTLFPLACANSSPGADSSAAADLFAVDLLADADPGPETVPEAGLDAVQPDPGPSDVPPVEVADAGPDLLSATSCGPGGVCIAPGGACPLAWQTGTRQGCVLASGAGTGTCCIPGGECQVDADCPDCELCDLPESGGHVCVDPVGTDGKRCSQSTDCPDGDCCSWSVFAGKPGCYGLCVPDTGAAECGVCLGEGMELTSGDGAGCCPGLTTVPASLGSVEGYCIPPRCIGCQICVKRCGDGVCSLGEDPCRCPADCPLSFAGGPGSKCESDADCRDGHGCLPEASGYPAGGYCTGGACNPDTKEAPCPGGSRCVGPTFAQAYLCLPSCRRDDDCREGLTCEALALGPGPGGYVCWEGGAVLGAALGQGCARDGDCISGLCLATPVDGPMVCSAYCDDSTPCKEGLACVPMGGCGAAPGCGACFAF